MVTHQFDINFNLPEVKGYTVSYPFYTVMQTESKEIEEYCFKQWNKLMFNTTVYDMNDQANQFRMEAYIKQKLAKTDANNIHKFFYDRNWLTPITFALGFTTISFNDFDCKVWTNPDVPFLQIKGKITIDIEKVLNHYINSSYVSMTRDNKFVRENIHIRFVRSLPLLMTYIFHGQVKDAIFKYLLTNSSKAGSVLAKKLEKLTGIKDLHKIKKKEFKFLGNSEIILEINDLITLLGIKAKKHPLALTAAGFIALNYFSKKNRRT